jgi:hypothetical protein
VPPSRRARRPAAVRTALLSALLALLPGCEALGLRPADPPPESVRDVPSVRQPDRVVVQHVLVSFDGADVPGVTRTRDEAERLAQRVHELARSGRDFPELVRLYSDDRHGDGTYVLVNYGVTPDDREVERRRMVRGFGNLAFTMEPGQVLLLPYHRNESPLGFHVLRRVR